MVSKVNIHHPVPPLEPGRTKQQKKSEDKGSHKSFQELLKKEITRGELKFSGHCIKRMQQNNINLSQGQLDKLSQAINKAEAKGAKESLVIMSDLALIVSVKNKTVITAVNGERMKENIFTNIDSAVII